MFDSKEEEELYFNTEQLIAYMLAFPEMFIIAGRAFGKTTNILAPALYRILQQMPQSMIALLGASYAQLVERVLPALLFQGLGKLGLENEEDFFVGKYGPKSWGWKKPFRHPITGDHIVHFFQGSCLAMVSMDRPNLSNGYEFDAVLGDEARLLKYDELQQFFQTIRGNEHKWGHLAAHQSKIFTTDYPNQNTGRWLLDKRKHNVSKEEKDLILRLAHLQSNLQMRYFKAKSASHRDVLEKQIAKIEAILNKLRKNKTYFKNISTLENAFVIGTNTIKGFQNNLSDFNYDTSVLGVFTNKVEGGFYSQLSDNNIIESGASNNYSIIDNDVIKIGIGNLKRDCRWDYLFQKSKTMFLGIDCNAGFNTCIVAQIIDNQIIIQNNLYVVNKPIKALVKDFAEYYKAAKSTPIMLISDYTFSQNNAINASSDEDGYTNYVLEWINGLRSYGFTVYTKEFPNLEEHSIRRSRAERSFLGEGFYKLKIVRETCQDLITALDQTEVKMVDGREKKNKDYEKRKKDRNGDMVFQKPPQIDTHSTDAFDNLLRELQVFEGIKDYSGFVG